MATDAIVVAAELPITVRAAEGPTTLAQFGPLQPGRSHLVWTCGYLVSRRVLVTVELEAFDAKHPIQLTRAQARSGRRDEAQSS